MQVSQPYVLMRDDTLLGVCEALGEDFGFNANYLRIALAVGVLWNPVAVILGYLALGAVVMVSRFVSPNKRPVADGGPAAEPQGAKRPEAGNDDVGMAAAA